MKTPPAKPDKSADLRQRAETQARAQAAAQPAPLTPAQTGQLTHELKVHQVELEMQNEELRRAQAALETARARYFDLYDLAPVGYVTLSEKELIQEANLTAASLLGVTRTQLVQQPLSHFVCPEDQDDYYRFRQQFTSSPAPTATGASRTCELRMARPDGTVLWVRLDATKAQDDSDAPVHRVILSDVTERKQLEAVQAFLAQHGGALVGLNFFEALARFLAQTLAMDFVCIDRLEGDGLTAQTVSVWCDGKFEDNTAYALKDTPCGEVVGQDVCCFPASVCQHFPRDTVLKDLRAESYLGVTLWGHAGQPIGLIAVIGRKALAHRPLAEAILKTVAVRAGAEMERLADEAALRASEEKFSALVAQSPLSIQLVDTHGKTLQVNRAFEELWGTPFARMGDYNLLEDPQFQDLSIKPILLRAFAGEAVEFPPVVFAPHSGSLTGLQRVVQASAYPIKDQAGKVRQVVLIHRDITAVMEATAALRASEEKYRGIFDESVAAIYVFDAQKHFIDSNQAGLALLGYTRAELLGLRLADVDAQPVEVLLAHRHLLAGGRLINFEHQLRRKDGRVITVLNNSRPLTDAQGQVVGLLSTLLDITDRKQVEEALQRNEAQLRITLNTTIDGILAVDRQGKILQVNHRFAELWQIPPAVMESHDDQRLLAFVLDQLAEPEAFLHKVQALYASDENEADLLTFKDGRIFERYSSPMVEAGGVTGRVWSFRDITERQRAKAALQASEADFRAMFEVASIGMAQTDPRTRRWLRVNQKMCQITGYAAEEMLQMEVGAITHPDDRQQDREAFQRVVRGEAPDYRMEKRYLCKDGTVAWVNVNMTVIRDAAGQPVRTMAVIEDISARKQAEQALQLQGAALAAAANAIVITDARGAIEWANPAFSALSGYALAEACGRNPRDLLKSGQQTAAFYAELWATIRAGQVWHGELVNRRKDGTLYTEDMTITPLRATGDAITHFIAIKQNVTERKELEAHLLRSQRLESVGRLASGIAHDLNNILAPVLLAPPLLRAAIKSPEARNLVDIIESSTQRGAQIIKQLLTFSRGLKGERVPLQLSLLVREMRSLMRETFPKNITVRLQLPTEIPLVLGDSTQLHQVLMNLCVNARDALPTGGELTISLAPLTLDAEAAAAIPGAYPGRFVVLGVGDSGTGIAPEILDKIFDPFFTTKPVGKGSGLGLSTTLGIVRSHAGFIQVHSEPAQGTQFRIFLPVSVQSLLVGSAAAAGLPDAPQGHGEQILVVDDEEHLRLMTRKILEGNGYHCLEAADGVEALRLLECRSALPQVVLTDLLMPRMDGPTLIRTLRQLPVSLKIIAMGGIPPPPETLQELGLTEQTFIAKPFEGAALLATLHAILA